eukprot:362534-Chlamydomonas_euryale.AAC.6
MSGRAAAASAADETFPTRNSSSGSGGGSSSSVSASPPPPPLLAVARLLLYLSDSASAGRRDAGLYVDRSACSTSASRSPLLRPCACACGTDCCWRGCSEFAAVAAGEPCAGLGCCRKSACPTGGGGGGSASPPKPPLSTGSSGGSSVPSVAAPDLTAGVAVCATGGGAPNSDAYDGGCSEASCGTAAGAFSMELSIAAKSGGSVVPATLPQGACDAADRACECADSCAWDAVGMNIAARSSICSAVTPAAAAAAPTPPLPPLNGPAVAAMHSTDASTTGAAAA